MTDTSVETDGHSARAEWQDVQEAPAARIAELEAENAALRRALALAGLGAGRAAGPRRGGEPGRGRAERAGDAAEARREREGAARPVDAEQAAAGRTAFLEREERPRLVLDSAADYAILTTDLDRRVTSWNAGAERLTGWAEAEVLGRSADAIFTPEDRAAGAPDREAAGALRDGRAANERWHARKDGSRFWGSGLVMPLRDPAAGPEAPPLGLLKIMRDRTERRRAEAALRSRERRLRLLADTATRLLAAADPDEVLAPVFRALSGEFGVAISLSYVVDEERGGLRLASSFGLPEVSRARFARLTLGEGLCGEAAQARRPVLVADALESSDPRCESLRGLAVRAYVAFPLLAGDGRFLGTLSFGSRGLFAEDDLAFLGTVAQHVAVVRERLRAEAALREGEARYRALTRASSDVLYRMSPDWAEMRQLSGGGFIADAPNPTRGWLADYIHPDDQPRVAAAVREAIRAKRVFELEHRIRRPDGSLGWTLSRAVPILGADGEVVEWFGAASDVTARREAEEALREAGARWHGLFERMHEGFALCEIVRGPGGGAADFRYLEVNAAWERLTGVPAADTVGRLASEAIPGIEPFWTDTYARVVETGEPAHIEHRVAPLGRWFEVMAYRTEPGRFAALFLDVTGRKAAEGRRALLVAELNHRVKNTLAVVQSLALQTARGAPDLAAFTAAFQARLMALARAHDLLTRESWEGAALADVVRAALEAGGEGRVDVDCGRGGGPDAAPLLAPAQALGLAMALHELATNALKHGALSVPGGRVSLRCRADPGSGARVVEWLERGGPPLAGPPARRGFGLRLLERGLAAQAGLEADLRFETRGVRCALRLPPVR